MTSLSSRKKLNLANIFKALKENGYNQSDLADKLSVTRQIVSQWLRNIKYPRPGHLLKMSKILNLNYNQLIAIDELEDEPVIAFRKKGNHKIDEEYKRQAKSKGYILEKLVPYLSFEQQFQQSKLVKPENEYGYIQKVAKYVRNEILFSDDEIINLKSLINYINSKDAVIIPVFWGNKSKHENALHVYLPKTKTTWIYLNLDTYLIDFKFWISHEIGHILAPDWFNDEAEDFADSFAGALLFPEKLAYREYLELNNIENVGFKINYIKNLAKKYTVSPITIFSEINNYARNYNKPEIKLNGKNSIYQAATNFRGKFNKKVNEILFGKKIPSSYEYVNKSESLFQTHFFSVLQKYITENKSSPHLIERLLDISYPDALSVYEEIN